MDEEQTDQLDEKTGNQIMQTHSHEDELLVRNYLWKNITRYSQIRNGNNSEQLKGSNHPEPNILLSGVEGQFSRGQLVKQTSGWEATVIKADQGQNSEPHETLP